MANLDWARKLAAATVAAGAVLGPLAVEAGRRTRRGSGDHAGSGIRDYWDRAGDGGRASASANGGSFVFGALDDSSLARDADGAIGNEVSVEKHGNNNNRNHNNNNNNNNNDNNTNDTGNNGDPVGGRAGDAASRLRDYADKLTGADRARGGNNGGDPGDTDTNISYDPETGAFGYDNGDLAYIRDADGSFFIQTGNMTFESGSGASLDGGGGTAGGGSAGGGGGGGGNNGGDNFPS
jgi:hypothetical protein